MSISFAATPQAKEGQQARAYTDDVSAGSPPSRRTGYDRPYVNRDHWNKVFTQPEYFDSIAKQKGMVEGAKVSLHGDDYVYRQAMMGYLSATRNVPLDDMRSIFDAEKDGFAQKVLGKKTATARELFDWHKTKFERDNEKQGAARQILEGVMERSLQDALSGGDTPFVESVAKDIDAASDFFDDEEKSRLWEKAEELDKKIRATQDRFAPEARFIFDALQQYSGQKEGFGAPDMRELAGRFASLPDNQRKAIYELVGGFASITKTDKGFFYQLAESLGRGTTDITERVPRNAQEQMLRNDLRLLSGDQPVFRGTGIQGEAYSAAGTKPLTLDEREQAKADVQQKLGVFKVQRELRDLAERVVDPIKMTGVLPEIVEEGLYAAARSVPYTAVAAVPFLGMPAVAAALYSSNYDNIMLEYPDIDPDKAALIAAISAPIEAGLERMKVNTLTGRLPVFGGLVRRLQHPNQRNIVRIAIGGAGIIAEQNVQEFVQEATFPIVRTIAAALDQDMPTYDWNKWAENLPRQLGVQFVALLPLSLIGMGSLSFREVARGERYMRDQTNLSRLGFSQAQIDRITGAATADKAQTILRDEHGKRDPEAVKAAAQRVLDEVLALREQKAPASLPRLEKQGADYVVLQPDGTVITRSTDQTVAEQALVSARRETVQREMRDVHTGINEAVEFIQKVNEARQRGEDIAKVIRESAPRTLLTDYEANPTQENLDRLFETVRAFGQEINEPAELASFPVTGSNQGALAEGIWRSIIRINEGADGTIVMREFAQDNLKRAISEGRVTMDFVRQQLNDILPQIDSSRIKRQLRTETDTDVIEAFSDVALAYFRGSIREEQIPAGLRGIMRRLAIISRDIFRRAYNLARLRAEGKLDRDFEALLAEAVGVNQQALVDRSRERTEQELGAAENYSIGLREPSATSFNETTLPDGSVRFIAYHGSEQALSQLDDRPIYVSSLADGAGYGDATRMVIEGRFLPDDQIEAFAAKYGIAMEDLFHDEASMEQDLQEALRSEGYDGAIYYDQRRDDGDVMPAAVIVNPNAIQVAPVSNYSIGISPTMDTDYLAAVERGDMEMAQRMVDAKMAKLIKDEGMVDLSPLYHGGPEGITVFSQSIGGRARRGSGIYLATTDMRNGGVLYSNEFARKYDNGKNYKLYALMKNPVITNERVTGNTGEWTQKQRDAGHDGVLSYEYFPTGKDVPASVVLAEVERRGGNSSDVPTVIENVRKLLPTGYDNVVSVFGKEIADSVFQRRLDQVVVFDPNQIKSADPVTRDADGNVIPLSQRFDATTADINYSIGISPAMDTDYLAAVERGDMEMAQRMVDEAARRAGYEIETWRGDHNSWNDFKNRREVGIFTSQDKQFADEYGLARRGVTRRFYVKTNSVLDLSNPNNSAMRWIKEWGEAWQEDGWTDRATGEDITAYDAITSGRLFDYEGDWSSERWQDLQLAAKNAGFDLLIVPDAATDIEEPTATIVLQDGNIKLADPVTYDASGNVIPLSQRFDATTADINYSVGFRSEAVDVFDGQSARDLLKSVPANSQFYEVAQTLSELKLPQLDEDRVEINRKRSGAARTSWGSRILSPSDVMGARTVIHEVVHTLTADAIDKYVTNKTRNGQAYVKQLRKVMADSDTPQPIRNLIEVYFATIDRLGLNDDLLGKTIDYVVPAKRKAFGFRRTNFGGQEQFYLDYDTKDTELLVDFMREQGVEFSTDSFGDQFVTGEQMQAVAAAAQNAGHRPRFADDFVFLHNFEVTPAKSRRKTTKAFVGQSATKVLKQALQSGVTNPVTGKPLTRGQMYGLTNLDEFLAQALSSRDFQELLSSIPAANENKSLWDKLVEAVAKLINWTGSETMLNSALTALSQVAEMQVMSSTSYFGDALIKNDAALDNYSISTSDILSRYEGMPSVVVEGGRPYSPIVRDLLKRRAAGEDIPREVIDQAINENFPAQLVEVPRSVAELPDRATIDDAIDKGQRDKRIDVSTIEAGEKVAIRQDVPAMTRKGVGVVTVKSKAGNSYEAAVRITEPDFILNEKKSLRIAMGEAKGPHIVINGKWAADQSMPADLETWTQVGYNPDRHSFYYDRATMQQVTGGSEAYQIGNTVFVKDAQYGDGQISDISYSIATQSEIDRVQKAMGALDRSPLSRLKVYEKMQERFLRVMADNRETLAAMESGDLSQVRRTQILQALGELDGIISALPAEIRSKIGGYTQLAKVDPMDVFKGDQKVSEVRGMSGAIISAWMREGLNIGQAQKKTELPAGYRADRNLDPTRADRAIADVFIQRINRINEALEKFLRDEYNDAAVELFKRAKPQRSGAGEKPKGKLGADVHALFDTLKEATEWSAEKAQAMADAELMRADSGELNPYDTNHAFMAAHLLRLFGNWANADSTQRASAVAAGLEVLNKAYKGEQQRIIAQRTKRGYDRTDLSKDAGVSAEDKKARQDAVKRENSLPTKWEAAMLNLLNFDQVLRYVFGNDSKIAQKISDRQRKADNVKSDDIAALSDDWASLLTRLGGGEMQGQQLLFDLSRMDEEIDDVSYSQNQLVAITMMWMQPKGRQHMEGFMDSDGQPAGKWHYNQAFVNKAEKLLRPESKVIREYLLLKYDQEYEAINKVYRKVYGLNLPKNQFYSPLSVDPINAPAQAGIDPVTGAVFAAGANSPSALRSRGGAIAEPVFRDAVQTYLGHMLQMAHWKAYAEFNGEVSALLGHRDTRNVVKGKAGEQAATVMNNWMQYFQQGGNKDAANHLAINQMINRITGNFAVMALFGRVSTLALQVTQLGAASVKMPVGAYLSRFGKLMSGNLNWKAALDSDYIQRRIKDMPPAVALAMQGLRSDKPSVIREASRRLGQLISGFDGFFTAGTYAIVYDYQLTQAQKNGMGGQEAADYAREATERIVDEIAQPTRAGTRSIYELNSTNPVARAVWAFSSEARKNFGLALYAGTKGRSGDFGKALFYVLILNGLVSTVIRSAFRDLRDDDDDEIFDEKNWGWNRMAAMLISDPLYGFPVVGEAIESGIFNAFGVYTPSGPLFDVAPAVPAVKRMAYDHPMALLEGEAEYRDILRDVNRILSTAGLFNSTIAGAASLTNLAKDSFEVGDNLLGDDE